MEINKKEFNVTLKNKYTSEVADMILFSEKDIIDMKNNNRYNIFLSKNHKWLKVLDDGYLLLVNYTIYDKKLNEINTNNIVENDWLLDIPLINIFYVNFTDKYSFNSIKIEDITNMFLGIQIMLFSVMMVLSINSFFYYYICLLLSGLGMGIFTINLKKHCKYNSNSYDENAVEIIKITEKNEDYIINNVDDKIYLTHKEKINKKMN